MTDARRYHEDEVAEIFRLASEADTARLPRGGEGTGVTLAELQEIGREVGIEPAAVARAASTLDHADSRNTPLFLGAPRAVSRTVTLERPLTDDEWLQVVALARQTFGARGRVETIGTMRTWYNGNLSVNVEPDGSAYRLRMSTLKGGVAEFAAMGGIFMLLGMAMAAMILLKRGLDESLIMAALFFVVGSTVALSARLRLPRWAEVRASQMDAIGQEVQALIQR